MNTGYKALLYKYEAHITRFFDVNHMRRKIGEAMYGDNDPEILGVFGSEEEAVECAKQPNVSPQLKDAWGSGKLLLWGTTAVVPFSVDEDGEETLDFDEEFVVQCLSEEDLVAFVANETESSEEEDEDE